MSLAPVVLLAAPVVARQTLGQQINAALADGRLRPMNATPMQCSETFNGLQVRSNIEDAFTDASVYGIGLYKTT